MISVSRLLCDEIGPGDYLRYGKGKDSLIGNAPIVVWNCTRRCNLHCIHCYASASNQDFNGELSTEEGKAFIRQLADFNVPVLLFSGGEPTMRADFLELAAYADSLGLGLVVSTNGTLIDREMAQSMGELKFREIGISIDAIGENNDRFRAHKGAFEEALRGIRICVDLGLRVSLRMTITKDNFREIPDVLDLVEREGINRVCFYHLAYAGRGNDLRDIDLSHAETRETVDLICNRTLDFHERGLTKEILLVGNHTDGIYLYIKAKARDEKRAESILALLRTNGGNNSGIRIGAVDELGNVHPDQFWRNLTLGNVRQRPFGEIWMDTSNPIMAGLKDRKGLLKGRCATCMYLDACNGNLRARGEAVFNDIWMEDPSCYLTDEEIGIC